MSDHTMFFPFGLDILSASHCDFEDPLTSGLLVFFFFPSLEVGQDSIDFRGSPPPLGAEAFKQRWLSYVFPRNLWLPRSQSPIWNFYQFPSPGNLPWGLVMWLGDQNSLRRPHQLLTLLLFSFLILYWSQQFWQFSPAARLPTYC